MSSRDKKIVLGGIRTTPRHATNIKDRKLSICTSIAKVFINHLCYKEMLTSYRVWAVSQVNADFIKLLKLRTYDE